MRVDIHFLGGPLDGSTTPYVRAHPRLVHDEYIDMTTCSVYRYTKKHPLAGPTSHIFIFERHFTPNNTPPKPVAPGPLPEVTVHGSKLMTLGQLAQFVDAARAAGYPDTHIPAVINSFGGRIRSLTAKSRRRTT